VQRPVSCINFLFSASHANRVSHLLPRRRPPSSHLAVRRARVSTDKISLGHRRRSLSQIRHRFINGHASARLLESGTRAYTLTFDRETFDDATDRVVKHTTA